MSGIVADQAQLDMTPFLIPGDWVNGSEDYVYDGDQDLFVLVSNVDRSKSGAPKNVVVYRQHFDGSLRLVLTLTSQVSYLGGRFAVTADGVGIVRVVGLDRTVRPVAVPGFVPLRSGGNPAVYPLALASPWTPYGPPFPPPVYRKTHDGMVVLQGVARGNGATEVASLIATLPPGYRPDSRLSFSANAGQSWVTAVGRLDVMPDGSLLSMTAHANWMSLSVSFFGGV